MISDAPEESGTAAVVVPQKTAGSERAWSIARLLKWGVIAVVVLVLPATAALVWSGTSEKSALGPLLTHTIAHGDLIVSVTEQGTMESSSNTEIKCRVRGGSTVLWVIATGSEVQPGDELVRLDTSTIEETINQQEIAYQKALGAYAQSKTAVSIATIAIDEYEKGTFRAEMKTLQKDRAIAEANLRSATNVLNHSQKMYRKGYSSALEVESSEFLVEQAQLELDVKQTEIDVLENFTKTRQLEELKSTKQAAEALMASDQAALELEERRLNRAKEQLELCVIKAPSSGIVIHPSAAQWRDQPDIVEGASVREDQVLLLIPDLGKMQVKVGVHESKIDRVKQGMKALVMLQDTILQGAVDSVASVTKPTGWWNGNVVEYDTIVKLDPGHSLSLKPGMTSEVEVVLAEYHDVLTVPVAAVLDLAGGFFCWVQTSNGPQRRTLELGDTNDQFIVVKSGLSEGDEVILNPRDTVEEASEESLKPVALDSGVNSTE
ncbi:HlyD family efflux transporter periplasmic adaptor subunit [bacterium]|nr:HlyD family efflux transporter periplasmic adaptor subunit [bacterium]